MYKRRAIHYHGSIKFQQTRDKQSKFKESANKINSSTATNGSTRNKFLGVRQRPSGKWVAEIKNTTQKIRIWLGTFDTAEEAAQAYDEAACLLRGSNTRTNFVHNPSNKPNSALTRRIRDLVNQKRSLNNNQQPSPPIVATVKVAKNDANTNLVLSQASCIVNPKSQMLHQNVYRPEMSGQFDYPCVYPSQLPHITDDLGLFPKSIGLTLSESEMNNEVAIPEFERMKVERQISASLYAMNGVHDYLESVLNVSDSNDPSPPTWDQPMLYQHFCLG